MDGASLGCAEGWLEGCDVGSIEMLGVSLGCVEGWPDGCEVGCEELEG